MISTTLCCRLIFSGLLMTPACLMTARPSGRPHRQQAAGLQQPYGRLVGKVCLQSRRALQRDRCGPSGEEPALLAAPSRLRHFCHLCKPVTRCYITKLQEKVQWCTSISAVGLSNAAQHPECRLWNSGSSGYKYSTWMYLTPQDEELLFTLCSMDYTIVVSEEVHCKM